MEERLELVGSIEGNGSSARVSSDSVSDVSVDNLTSLPADPALAGGDLGEPSPEFVSLPKNVHFFADLGVDGAETEAAAASMSLQ
jgi:hypothetical protein